MALPAELVCTRDEAATFWRFRRNIVRGLWLAATAVISLFAIIPVAVWATDHRKVHAVAAITAVGDGEGEVVVTWVDGSTHEARLRRVLVEDRAFAGPSRLVVGQPIEIVYDEGAYDTANQPANLYPGFVGLGVVALWIGASLLVSRLRPLLARQCAALLADGGPAQVVTGVVEVRRGGEGDSGASIGFWTERDDPVGPPSLRIQLDRAPAGEKPGWRRSVASAPQQLEAIGDVRPGGAVILCEGDLVVRTCGRVQRVRSQRLAR